MALGERTSPLSDIPFTLLSVSWPQSVRERDWSWVSDPVWDAPPTPTLPVWKLHLIDDVPCWSIDWRDFFRADARCHNVYIGGEMRRFHIVFRLQVHASGTLHFWDDDGSIIRRRREIVHHDRAAHRLQRHAIEVAAGDELEIAQWQIGWDWFWCARIEAPDAPPPLRSHDYLRPYLPQVWEQLKHPAGPPLKMYTSGRTALRVIASIYSFVLNGYTPSQIVLFGEEQWSEKTRWLFSEFLPFARVVSQAEALDAVGRYGGHALAQRARDHWFVMKAFVALALPPWDSCLMDDDVLILDRLDEALSAFTRCELVYNPDQDLTEGYTRTWQLHFGRRIPLKTCRFNAGLYWIRNLPDRALISRAALRTPPRPATSFDWEQGLIACAYADRPTHELPSQTYFYPLFDGLPGGILGYDYRRNPCGFVSIHYGGLAEKPSDAAVIQILSDVLDRGRNVAVREYAIA